MPRWSLGPFRREGRARLTGGQERPDSKLDALTDDVTQQGTSPADPSVRLSLLPPVTLLCFCSAALVLATHWLAEQPVTYVIASKAFPRRGAKTFKFESSARMCGIKYNGTPKSSRGARVLTSEFGNTRAAAHHPTNQRRPTKPIKNINLPWPFALGLGPPPSMPFFPAKESSPPRTGRIDNGSPLNL
jgi:hypothetical protein